MRNLYIILVALFMGIPELRAQNESAESNVEPSNSIGVLEAALSGLSI